MHTREVVLKNGKFQRIYFFARDIRDGALATLPVGYHVVETSRTGMPVLRAQVEAGGIHFKIIRQGAKFWNNWRETNPQITPDIGVDLWREDLRDFNLSDINFEDAFLVAANLDNANLSNCNLNGANLTNSSLRNANLSGASLIGAQLTYSDLREAVVKNADASNAELSNTILENTDFTNSSLIETKLHNSLFINTIIKNADLTLAEFDSTTFVNIDFASVNGLEETLHSGPSFISIDTLTQAISSLPISFLSGCGVSDLQIQMAKLSNPNLTKENLNTILEAVKSLTLSSKSQYPSCFISYSNVDSFADQLFKDLRNNGVRCWFAKASLKGGKKVHDQINDALRQHDKFILILSRDSIKSSWVEYEIKRAKKREKEEGKQIMFPISLVPYEELKDWYLFDADLATDLAAEIREYFIPNFSQWENNSIYQKGLHELLATLQTE